MCSQSACYIARRLEVAPEKPASEGKADRPPARTGYAAQAPRAMSAVYAVRAGGRLAERLQARLPVASLSWRSAVWRTLYGLRDKTLQVIVSGASSKDDKLIALTFDDGPTLAYTPRVLATLAQHRIKATFFMIGQQVQAHPDIARQVCRAGHAIGNHTYSHARLMGLGARGVLDEVRRCQRTLREHAQVNPNLLRPPFGLRDVTAHIAIRALGFHIVNWSNSAEDWRGDNAATLAERVTCAAQPGHIILMHDGCGASDNVEVNPDRTPTVLALPMIVSQLHEQGYRFVTLPQLFAAAAPKRQAWF